MSEERASDDTAEIPVVVPAEPPSAQPSAIAGHRAPRRRRRWPWISLGVVLVALALVASGGLWHLSGLIGDGARIASSDEPFPMTVTAAQGTSVTYSAGSPARDDVPDQGLMGIATIEGGYSQTDDPVASGDLTTRSVVAVVLPPNPAAGQAATLDSWYFPKNPRVGLGVEFEDVTYDAPLGPTPAWFIPGTSTTWVIFTHGRGATPAEGLRIANTVTGLGYPMLLIKYRDDALSPQEDQMGGFGAQEWPDLEAAVQYAMDHGATKVVLTGASMGGAITLAFLENSALADRVAGVFLDSPITSFGKLVDARAADMGVPSIATGAARVIAGLRFGFDWDATDYSARAAGFAAPMLLVQGTADATVPATVVAQFAAAADAATVTLEEFDGAGHVMSWNVDRPRYEGLLTEFLGRVAPVG